jgi:hypothetical protein
MDTQDYLDAINAGGINSVGVEWTTEVKPAAKWRGHTLTKITRALVMTGVEYANLAVNKDTETGALPWGEWKRYPYVIEHKGQEYVRVNTIDRTLTTLYYVDGIDVDRQQFLDYLTPSQREAKRPNGGTLTIKASNMRLVGDASLALA